MKKQLLTLSFLFAAIAGYSATNVQGVISSNTTWTKANSPYVLTGDLLVDAPFKLIVEPGVEIMGSANMKFYVDGSMEAIGLPNDPIIFRSADSTVKWIGLRFRNEPNDTTLIRYCEFRMVAKCMDGNRNYQVENCKFYDVDQAVYMYGKYVRIEGCSFMGGGSALSGGNMKADFFNNEVKKMWEGVSLSDVNDVVISGNVFDSNNKAMKVEGHAININHNIITNSNTGVRLNCLSANSYPLQNNVFAYNKTALDFSPYTNTRILYNTFKYNENAVLMQVNYTNVVFNNNCFENNTNKDVELKYSSKTVHFTENYWGTTDSASIHARITDFYSNFNLPKAFFMPVLQQADSSCQIVSPTAIVKVKEDVQQVICYPNPAIETIVLHFPHLKASEICLYDLNGRTLVRYNARGKNEVSVNVSGLSPGLYIYHVSSTNGEKYTGKFQKN